jgi:hypothetical protein
VLRLLWLACLLVACFGLWLLGSTGSRDTSVDPDAPPPSA